VSGVTRVLIADDQEPIRHGFRLILDAQPDMQVVGEAADGETAVAQARRVRADVVLADIRMPRLDGLEVTRRLAGPGVEDPIRVIVVTPFDLDEYVHSALRHGACGFLLKRVGPVLLVEAIRAAMAGDVLVSPSVTVRLLRHITKPRPSPPSRSPRASSTSPGLSRTGARTRDRCRAVHLAGHRQDAHRQHQRKLGVRNRVGIAAWAWDTGRVTG
jgi:DNA-binding NarL/FixJ family response regulator